MPWEGVIAKMRRDEEKTREYYAGAIDYYRTTLAQTANDLNALSGLSLAYAALGRKEEAIRQAQHAVELVPLSSHALDAPIQIVVLADVHAELGEGDAALEQLATVVP